MKRKMMSVIVVFIVIACADGAISHSRKQPVFRLRGGDTARDSLSVVKRPQSLHSLCHKQALRGGIQTRIDPPKELKLAFGAAGIFLSFSVFAVLQEDVYKKAYGGEYFASTFFALVVERGINALTALLGDRLLGSSGLVIPYIEIFNSGISQMLAMAASNEALRFVSYPTQVLGKSCKMVPVMAGAIVLSGKRYSLIEYAQVILITLGVCIFNFGGKKKKSGKADSPYGLALIAASLLMDAFTGGLQDKVKVRTKELNPFPSGASKRPSMHESMLWTNLSGCIVALLLALVSGHLISGFRFCSAHPQVLQAIVVYSVSSAVGQNFVYYTLTQFNPLVLTTVTTTRKIFSTLFSVFRNPQNSLLPMQWAGCMLVFIGLIGDIVRKLAAPSKPASKPKLADAEVGTNECPPPPQLPPTLQAMEGNIVSVDAVSVEPKTVPNSL
eukprot:CAMPEP_0119299462 /NCGR_PEP_ID=MMETSP1333-20130426/1535_1 /TAXON_ID=418940 /ORGANISM="Scyphosphaera apsteinii, Strain RCC1455" /LENGTH=441 /DNA_ID=CAMNT_0007300907 /DNA_START=26 /DNA_END=1351 /DNA_ORIENTATION=+